MYVCTYNLNNTHHVLVHSTYSMYMYCTLCSLLWIPDEILPANLLSTQMRGSFVCAQQYVHNEALCVQYWAFFIAEFTAQPGVIDSTHTCTVHTQCYNYNGCLGHTVHHSLVDYRTTYMYMHVYVCICSISYVRVVWGLSAMDLVGCYTLCCVSTSALYCKYA